MNNVIACESLCKSFTDGQTQVDVLNQLNLSVAPGETVAIVGSSGSGKTTLLQLLGGLDKPTSGQVKINGKNIAVLSERARCELRNHSLGFIYQFHHLLPEFSALENVCMPLWIAGKKQKQAVEIASDIIHQVNLSHRLHHRVTTLSGGERQRIAIARALVNNPSCVLADERTGILDQTTANHVFVLMLSLNKK